MPSNLRTDRSASSIACWCGTPGAVMAHGSRFKCARGIARLVLPVNKTALHHAVRKFASTVRKAQVQ